jgi:hypothetical protein
MTTYEERRERQRRFFRRNFFWIAPLALIGGAGVFIGIGFLVPWLWRVTVGDIFGFKPISFWQAWGLILLSQFLFKANMQRSFPARSMRWRAHQRGAGSASPEAEH